MLLPMTRGRWRAVFFFVALALLPLALMPFEMEKKDGLAHGDKVAHVLAFACMAYAAWRAWPERARTIGLALAGYGAAIEILQSLTPARSASLGDFAADVAGVALGLALAHTWARVLTRARA